MISVRILSEELNTAQVLNLLRLIVFVLMQRQMTVRMSVFRLARVMSMPVDVHQVAGDQQSVVR